MSKNRKITLKLPQSKKVDFGAVKFFQYGAEVMYCNPRTGRPAKSQDYIYTTTPEPIHYVVFDGKTGGVHVTADFTIQELRKLLRVAEKRAKEFKYGHFIHAGNLSMWITKGKKNGK